MPLYLDQRVRLTRLPLALRAKRADPRMVIKAHRPWRKWLFRILLVISGGIVGWLLPAQITQLLGPTPDESALPSAHSSRERLSQVERENIRLRKSLARIQQRLEVEHQTRINLGSALSALQSEVLELQNQLAIYKGLVKPLKEQRVYIQSFTLKKTEIEQLLSYRLVLTQGGRRGQFTQGTGQLSIYGVLDGEPVQLDLGVLSKEMPLTFKFKYFQILEGELLLPDNFKPIRLKVALFPEDESSGPVERDFDWASLAG